MIWSSFLIEILYPSKIKLDAYGEGGRSISQQRDFPSWDETHSQGPIPDFTSWSFHWLRPSDRTLSSCWISLVPLHSALHHTSLHYYYVFIYLFTCFSYLYVCRALCLALSHLDVFFFNSTARSMITEMPSVVMTPFTVWTYGRYSISACYISLCEIIPSTSAIVCYGSPTIHPPKIGKLPKSLRKGKTQNFQDKPSKE